MLTGCLFNSELGTHTSLWPRQDVDRAGGIILNHSVAEGPGGKRRTRATGSVDARQRGGRGAVAGGRPGGGCRLYGGGAAYSARERLGGVGHGRGAVRVRDFRRATTGSVEEIYR